MKSRARWLVTVVVALACATTALVNVSPADAASRPVRVGSLTLHPCDVAARALCGSIRRPWAPSRPNGGRVKVGFAFVPASDRSHPSLGTVVPHEGGPGYSTTASASYYVPMYGSLLRRRNLLLVDQRGTGLSQALSCPDLQDLKIAYAVAAGRCGRSLGARADDYTTALSADDLNAVIHLLGLGAVDVYGDSYGTFFAQVFAGRHPSRVRSVILDSAYPTYGESAWYPTQTPAMQRAFDLACRRSAACKNGGASFMTTLRRVLEIVRAKPWRGVSHDADGRRARVVVNGPTLVSVAFGATYGPPFYRELTAALRSGLRGDRAPLLRLVAEAIGGGTDAGDPVDYSEGLDAAVACHDYPQLYDMTAAPSTRERQYRAALAQRARSRPATYGPFTVHEYARSDWQSLDWCTRWPAAPSSNPAGPPTPPAGSYSSVPVLVLSGEMDSITTAAEGALITDQFPNAQQVLLRNSFHVTAMGDIDNCGQRLVRAFVRTAAPLSTAQRACADRIEPVRALGSFPRRLADVPAAPGSGTVRARRAGPAAALTVADVVDRWSNNYSGEGFGLRGGRWTYGGDHVTTFRLRNVRLVPGISVSGTARWARYRHRIRVDLRLRGAGPKGRLRGGWNTRSVAATAVLVGRLDGRPVRVRFRAP